MQDPHDLIWKFWASEQMAMDMCDEITELYYIPNYMQYQSEFNREIRIALAQILKKEWFR